MKVRSSWLNINGTAEDFEISLADFKAAIGELSIFQQENYASKAGKTEYLPEFIDEKTKSPCSYR